MPLFNRAWKRKFFWDVLSLRAQVLMPIQNPVAMHETLPSVVGKLRAHSEYPVMFERAFGDRMVDADPMALEQFLFTVVSYDSRFDLAIRKEAQLTEEEKRGFFLFMSEYDPRRGMYGADCFHCHGGPFFSSLIAERGADCTLHARWQIPDLGAGRCALQFRRRTFAVARRKSCQTSCWGNPAEDLDRR
ncbi:MAG: cytochrome-c peroxidase [Verrucomicrobiia bacterium]|jgi:cytochrome c peroxidase